AVGDVNDDGLLDVFIADANRLYVSRPDRTYRRLEPAPFVGPLYGRRDVMTCGAALGDLTGDGLLDLVTTVHGEPGQVDVYIHRGLDDSGMPRYERVTAAVGLDRPLPRRGTTGLPITGAHVAIADFNNDGRNDVFLSMLHRDA